MPLTKYLKTLALIHAGFCLTTFGQVAADSQRLPKNTQTYLFMDWHDIEKGRIMSVYDEKRLTEQAKTNFANLKKEWNIDTKLGKHGTTTYHLPRGIRITVEKARKSRPWLLPDQPWEEQISGGNVIYDQGKFRCWYSATMPKQPVGVVYVAEGRAMETNGTSMCYMESTDGIKWIKPALGIFSYKGSKENNMISPLWIDTPFRDDHGKPEERYKAWTFEELPADEVPKGAGPFHKYGLYGMVSADGHNWTKLPKPLIRHFADTWNIAGWDPLLKKYVGYFRGHTGGRSITRAETDDFHNWPMPTTVFCTGPEERPITDYYSSGYTSYPGIPGIRLMFPGIYYLDTSKIDSRLAISRDNEGWNFVSHDPIIQNGREGEWDAGMLFGQPDLLRLPDGRLALPYSGYNHGHDTGFSDVYKDPPKHESGMAWALWDEGRLAGIEAEKSGEFWAANSVTDAAEIQINARTASRGTIEVQLVQKENVLPGFSFADCVPVTGNKAWGTLRWKGKADLSELQGKKYQIHFRLTKAKIFGYRTVNAPRSAEKK
jgi:hypothetical protein